jgi:acyl-[acyl-carrier-protein]-phospholipid O-acyltransferase/long-chain-fatty-acid--[acyl-carrier-protein] ligase
MTERGTTDDVAHQEAAVSAPVPVPAAAPVDAPRPAAPPAAARIAGAPFNMKLTRRTLMGALLRARTWYGGKRVCIVDGDGREMSYDELIQAAFALGHSLTSGVPKGGAIALLLPTGIGAAVSFFGVTAYGRVPAMLNFTSGARALNAACAACGAKRIVTARKFVEVGGFHDLVAKLGRDHDIVYLEDVRAGLTPMAKTAAVVSKFAPWLIRAHASPDEPGVYLFTSGTEGDPKGVVLSHANVIANAEQARQHIPELYPTDTVVMPLPTFHCFGLTAGLLLPLLAGFKAALHPTPLQAKTIVERVRDLKATLLFATDTFLNQYARVAEDDDLKTLRFAVCGAERVKDETRAALRRRFGIEIIEGYGVTEAAPVIAANQVSFNKPGTVGRLMPGMEGRIEPVPGIADGGRFYVRGPNVMRGYVGCDGPGCVAELEDGWHDTGDIVSVDEDGFITIRGRVKRFAKMGGEMVSLAVVENCAASLWPESRHAAIAAPGQRKGEEIVLVTDSPHATRADLVAFARSHGVSELAVPRRIVTVDAVPILGAGKIDYAAVERLAREQEKAAPVAQPATEPAK